MSSAYSATFIAYITGVLLFSYIYIYTAYIAVVLCILLHVLLMLQEFCIFYNMCCLYCRSSVYSVTCTAYIARVLCIL